MRRMNWILFLALFTIYSTQAFSTRLNIKGVVVEAETGNPLQGADVLVKGTFAGVATDMSGRFSFFFDTDQEFTLVVRYMGYKTQERRLSLSDDLTNLRFEMVVDVFRGEEIVVTGIASRREKSVAEVAVSRIDATELTESNSYQEISQLMAGKIAGVNIKPASGNIGGGIRFTMRSGGGLNGDEQPVIYLDGVRMNNSEFEGFWYGGQGTSTLADLNPEDIEKIEVLKGPAGAASYGTSGSNGVILITTKRGAFIPGKPKGVSVTYKMVTGYNTQSRLYTEEDFLTYKDANAIFRDGRVLQHSLSFSGGMGLMKYYVGLDRRSEYGIIPQNAMDRYTVKANFDVLPSDKLLINVSTSYSLNDIARPVNDNENGFLMNVTSLPQPYVYADSIALVSIENLVKSNRLIGSLQAQYKPYENLGFRFSLGIDDGNIRNDYTQPAHIEYYKYQRGGRLIGYEQTTQLNFSIDGRYSYSFFSDLNITSIIGTQLFDRRNKIFWGGREDFPTELIPAIDTGEKYIHLREFSSNSREAGIFTEHLASYRDQYYLSFMLRKDYASTIGEKAPSIFYPRVSFALRFDKYSFFPKLFDLMKFRIAYGESGVLPELTDGIPLLWRSMRSGYGVGAAPASIGNENIKPERLKEFEIGIEAEFFQKYAIDFTYYIQRSSDSIMEFYNAPSTGKIATPVPFNIGKIEGWGVESLLRAKLFGGNDIQCDLSLTNNYQNNEVKDMGGAQPIYGWINANVIKEGLPKHAFYMLKVEGALFNEDGSYKGPDVTDDRVYLGTPVPTYTGSLLLTLHFLNNFKLSVFSDWATGHSILNLSEQWAIYTGNTSGMGANNKKYRELEDMLGIREWYDTIDPLPIGSNEYRKAADEFAKMDYNYDSNFIEDADFFKIREVSLSYSFQDLLPKFYMSPLISDLVIGLTARNLWTTTKYSGADVELSTQGSRALARGIDFATLMHPRVYTFWLRIAL